MAEHWRNHLKKRFVQFLRKTNRQRVAAANDRSPEISCRARHRLDQLRITRPFLHQIKMPHLLALRNMQLLNPIQQSQNVTT